MLNNQSVRNALRSSSCAAVETMEARRLLSAALLTGTSIGTAGSYLNDGNVAANALDDNLNTFFNGPNNSGDFIELDLGYGKVVSQIRYAPRSGWASRLVGGMIQASNSANFSTGVVTLATITDGTDIQGNIALTNTTAYRYIGPLLDIATSPT